jgi:hypothetical protein
MVTEGGNEGIIESPTTVLVCALRAIDGSGLMPNRQVTHRCFRKLASQRCRLLPGKMAKILPRWDYPENYESRLAATLWLILCMR